MLRRCAALVEYRAVDPAEIEAVACRPDHGRDARSPHVENIDLAKRLGDFAQVGIEPLLARHRHPRAVDERIDRLDELHEALVSRLSGSHSDQRQDAIGRPQRPAGFRAR
jgi:hypothetical protein